MGMRTGVNAPALLVDKYINTAYDNVKKVADSIDNVNTLADNLELIDDVAEDFNIVASNIDNVVAAGSNTNNINTIVANLSVITPVADNIYRVSVVADNMDSVIINVDNIDSINTNASNIVSIQSASANASIAQQSAHDAATIADSLFYSYPGMSRLSLMQFANTSFPDALAASPITNDHPDDVTPAYNALSTSDVEYSFGEVEFNPSAGFSIEHVPAVKTDLASNLYMGSYDCGFVVNTREYPPLSVILDQTLDFNELDLHTDFDVMYFDEYDFNV